VAENDRILCQKVGVNRTSFKFLCNITMVMSAFVWSASGVAQEASKTVIGPTNIDLADGASALMAGDAAEGVRLTLRGLASAQGNRERKTAHSNLCAGYMMLDLPRKALEHCDAAIGLDETFWRAYNNRALVYLALDRYEEAEADIRRGQELRPNETKLKIVKGMLLDETQPVTERVEIDERRSAMEDSGEADSDDE